MVSRCTMRFFRAFRWPFLGSRTPRWVTSQSHRLHRYPDIRCTGRAGHGSAPSAVGTHHRQHRDVGARVTGGVSDSASGGIVVRPKYREYGSTVGESVMLQEEDQINLSISTKVLRLEREKKKKKLSTHRFQGKPLPISIWSVCFHWRPCMECQSSLGS
jgi:hypothetical protein